MRERDRNRAVRFVTPSDALADALQSEQPPHGQAADRDDQSGPDQPKLPVPPEGAELLLARSRRPLASSRRRLARVAARDRGAGDGAVDLLLLGLEPAAKRPAGAAAPGPPLLAFDYAGRLAEDVRALADVRLDDRRRLQWIAGFETSPA